MPELTEEEKKKQAADEAKKKMTALQAAGNDVLAAREAHEADPNNAELKEKLEKAEEAFDEKYKEVLDKAKEIADKLAGNDTMSQFMAFLQGMRYLSKQGMMTPEAGKLQQEKREETVLGKALAGVGEVRNFVFNATGSLLLGVGAGLNKLGDKAREWGHKQRNEPDAGTARKTAGAVATGVGYVAQGVGVAAQVPGLIATGVQDMVGGAARIVAGRENWGSLSEQWNRMCTQGKKRLDEVYQALPTRPGVAPVSPPPEAPALR
jgi:hypothetical protein